MLTNAPANTLAGLLKLNIAHAATVHAVLKAVESWAVASAPRTGPEYGRALLELARAAANVARFH